MCRGRVEAGLSTDLRFDVSALIAKFIESKLKSDTGLVNIQDASSVQYKHPVNPSS